MARFGNNNTPQNQGPPQLTEEQKAQQAEARRIYYGGLPPAQPAQPAPPAPPTSQPGQPAPPTQPSGQPETQIPIGTKLFLERLQNNEQFKENFKKIGTLLVLMQTHLRLTETGEQSLLEYLGFNEEIVFKYLWAIFIVFNSQQFRDPENIIWILREEDAEGEIDVGYNGPFKTCNVALGMDEQLDERIAGARLDQFERMLLNLTSLMKLADNKRIWDIIHKIIRKENQNLNGVGKKIWIQLKEQIDEARVQKYYQTENPKTKSKFMKHDVGILDRIIDQNGGDLTINLREVLHPNQALQPAPPAPTQPQPAPAIPTQPQPAPQPAAPQPTPQPQPPAPQPVPQTTPQPDPQPTPQPAPAPVVSLLATDPAPAEPEEFELDDKDLEWVDDPTEPDTAMPNLEPATENTGIDLTEFSGRCDADPDLKTAVENLNVIFVVLKRSKDLDPEKKLRALLNSQIPGNNINLLGSLMEIADKKTATEFIIDHFGITDIDVLTAKIIEIDQQCKEDKGVYALLADLLKKDTATNDEPQADEEPNPQPADDDPQAAEQPDPQPVNNEPNTQWFDETDPFDELAEMTSDEPIVPPKSEPTPNPDPEPIDDDPYSEENMGGGD